MSCDLCVETRTAYFKESQVGWSVEEVCQRDEGIPRIHVQEKDTSKEGHALDVSNVRTVTGVSTKDITQGLVIGSTLRGGGGGGGG